MEFKVGFSLFKPSSETHLIAKRKVCLQGITSQPPQLAPLSFSDLRPHSGQVQAPAPGGHEARKERGARIREGEGGGKKRGKGTAGEGGVRRNKRKESKRTQFPSGPILHSFDHFWKDGLRKYNYSQLSITAARKEVLYKC